MSDLFVHRLALVETTDVGAGTRVWGFSHLCEGARVGKKCNIGEHCYIEGGAIVGNGVTIKNGISLWKGLTVEDDVFLGPHAIFTNVLKPRAFIKAGPEAFLPTHIGKGATVGAGAVIVCGITIGEYAFIAAGAVVTKDVPAYAWVAGNPAMIKGSVCQCAGVFYKEIKGAPRECERCNILPG